MPTAQARLADLSVALLAPLPLSFWFIPYHAVVMVPIYLLLVSIAIVSTYPVWLRSTAAAACLICLIIRMAIPDWNVRGAIFLASFVFLLLALGAVRRFLAADK